MRKNYCTRIYSGDINRIKLSAIKQGINSSDVMNILLLMWFEKYEGSEFVKAKKRNNDIKVSHNFRINTDILHDLKIYAVAKEVNVCDIVQKAVDDYLKGGKKNG